MDFESKNSFILYSNYYEILSDLTDEQMGKLFRAILEYKTTGKQPVVSVDLLVVFKFIKNQIDIDTEKFMTKVERNRQNGRKGGAPKGNQNAKKQPKTTQTTQNKHNENVNENENENENENVNENDFSFLEKKQPEEKQKKSDPFIDNPIVEKFKSEHERILGNKPYLTAQQRMKIMELNSEIPEFMDTITTAFLKVKNIKFNFENFTPNGGWLLKEDNYTNVLNGMYDRNETKEESKDWRENPPDWYKKAMERKRAEGCIYD